MPIDMKESSNSLCNSLFSIEVIDKSVKSLKIGKAQGTDSLSAEHLLHSHPIIYLHCCNLFKSHVIHGFVPDNFGNGLIIPFIKDKSSPVGSSSNYRANTPIPVISKLFEGVLLNIANDLLMFDDHQFGLKKNSGCANALYTFRSTVDYFYANGSSVYVATLDVSKPFDVINHSKLFSALINIGTPRWIIDLLVYWYSKLKFAVRFKNVLSYTIMVFSGVRQGSCLSPSLLICLLSTCVELVSVAMLNRCL